MPRRKTKKYSPLYAALVEGALEFFLSSIRDPHNMLHCGTCLIGALEVSTKAEQQPVELMAQGIRKRIKADPELYNATLTFLLTKRTDKQMEILLARLSECHCQMDDQAGTLNGITKLVKRRTRWRPNFCTANTIYQIKFWAKCAFFLHF